MDKLFVAGCSVSDYTKVDHTYGEILSNMLNVKYVHEGSGCGSNWRIWRRIVGHIINGNLTSKDLLIVQYTTIERKEFWSFNELEHNNGKIKLRERFENGGDIIKFKLGIHEHQYFSNEKHLFKLIENGFINTEYEEELFFTQNLMFQSLLKMYNIPTIFFDFYKTVNNFELISPYDKFLFNVDEIKNNDNYLLPDLWHFNELGHKYVAEKLYDFINENYSHVFTPKII